MPLDTSIPLRSVAPEFNPNVGTENAMNMAKLAYLPKQMAQEEKLNNIKLSSAELEQHKAINNFVYNTLAQAKTQDSYDAAKAQIASSGNPELAKLAAQAPAVFDPNFVQSALMSTLDTKDRLDLMSKEAERNFERDKFAETQRHNKATEGAMGSFGNGLEGRAYNILLNGDPSSPEYALAAMAATKPRYQPVTNADGTTQLVAVTPELPSSIARPGNAPDPRAPLTPPAMPGTVDNTPTSTIDLLPPPNSRSFSATPVAGTVGAAKLTEDQTKAAGFTERLQSAVSDLDRVTNAGYKPSVATNVGTSLNNLTGTSNFLSSEGQQLDQSKRNFITAQLRRESGAAIAPSEFENANKQYFPEPGDKPEVLAQKKRNRQDAIAAMKTSAGGAYKAKQETPADFSKMSDDEIKKALGL